MLPGVTGLDFAKKIALEMTLGYKRFFKDNDGILNYGPVKKIIGEGSERKTERVYIKPSKEEIIESIDTLTPYELNSLRESDHDSYTKIYAHYINVPVYRRKDVAPDVNIFNRFPALHSFKKDLGQMYFLVHPDFIIPVLYRPDISPYLMYDNIYLLVWDPDFNGNQEFIKILNSIREFLGQRRKATILSNQTLF